MDIHFGLEGWSIRDSDANDNVILNRILQKRGMPKIICNLSPDERRRAVKHLQGGNIEIGAITKNILMQTLNSIWAAAGMVCQLFRNLIGRTEYLEPINNAGNSEPDEPDNLVKDEPDNLVEDVLSASNIDRSIIRKQIYEFKKLLLNKDPECPICTDNMEMDTSTMT